MILEGNQRGGALQMAQHLMNTKENDHVEVHEVSGFLSDTVQGALHEIHAAARGTKCKQFMFSVSLNPPHNETVPVEYFEKALDDIEKQLGLKGQPRVVVFHEKEGRRHAHCIWSRINADDMKAINLPFYKKKLNDISKKTYLEYGWNVPKGFINKAYRNPLNFSREEWQQAKRTEEDPRLLKALFKTAWESSDNKAAFINALREHGFWLARGNRRGFVAVDYKGEIYSLSRWMGVKTKDIKIRLGEAENLPSAEDIKAKIAHKMTDTLKQYIADVRTRINKDREPLKRAIQTLKTRHQNERNVLHGLQKERWTSEERARVERLPYGFMGLWHRITGKYQKARKINEQETLQYKRRDRDEKQTLINKQLAERGRLQERIQHARHTQYQTIHELRQDVGGYKEMKEFSSCTHEQQQNQGMEM